MLERFNKVDNPLTIIAIFAGITEVASAISLPFLEQGTQQVFIWFLILFPLVLVAAFFVTLNFNARVLYAPADYRDEKHFLEALRLSGNTVQVSVTSPDDIPPSITELRDRTHSETDMSPFEGVTRPELDAVNAALHAFGEKAQSLFRQEFITGYSFGIEGEGLFLLNVFVQKDGFVQEVNGPPVESRIIRPSTDADGMVQLSIVGKNAKTSGIEEFAAALVQSIETSIRRRREQAKREWEVRPGKAIDVDE